MTALSLSSFSVTWAPQAADSFILQVFPDGNPQQTITDIMGFGWTVTGITAASEYIFKLSSWFDGSSYNSTSVTFIFNGK